MRSLKSSPTTVYISHVRYKATAQGSPEESNDKRSVGETNVTAVVSDQLESNSSVKLHGSGTSLRLSVLNKLRSCSGASCRVDAQFV